MLSDESCKEHSKVLTTHPWWAKDIVRIPRLIGLKKLYVTVIGGDEKKRRRYFSTEQKSASCMDDRVNMFLKYGVHSVDLYSSTFATAKVCSEVPRHSRFMGCEVDAYCFAASTGTLFETYRKLVLSEKSDFFRKVDVCKMVIGALDGLRTKKWMRYWKLPVSFCPLQTFRSHITHF